MARLRAAVVGAGLMGRWHATYARRAGAAVVAIVDRDPAARRALASAGAVSFHDLHDALREGRPDVVHVCTPLESHFAIARDALAAGAHVIVEKPTATSSAEARALVETARSLGRTLVAVHQLPFQRGFGRLRAALPRLGDLVEVEYRLCSAGGEGRPPDARLEVLLEMLPHPDSLFRAVLGECYEPGALAVASFSQHDLVLVGNAGTVRLEACLSLRGRPPRHELRVTGTRGTCWVDLFHGFQVMEPGGTSRTARALRPFGHGVAVLAAASANLAGRFARCEPAYPGLLPLIGGFYAAARGDTPTPVDGCEIVGSVELMERVRGAARAGSAASAPCSSE